MSKTRTRKKRRIASKFRTARDEQGRFGWNQTFSLTVVGIISCLHLCGLAALFSPASGIFNTQPLIDQDWGLHFHHLNSLVAFWYQDKMVWGYNPFFMAGYPSNTIQDLSIKFFEFVALLLSTIALLPIQWFKITAFLAMASVPWLMYFAARNFFFGHDTKHLIATLAALCGTIYWWNSLPREMFFYGMLGFPVASYLSILGVSLFYRIARSSEKFGWAHIGWLIFAMAILPLHIQSIVSFLPPMIALLVIEPRLVTRRLVAWSAAATALAFLVNSAWLIPAFGHRADDASAAIVDQLPLFASANPFTFFLDYLGPNGFWTFRPSFMEKGVRVALLVLGIMGMPKLLHSDKRQVGIMLTSASVVLFTVTYFGALFPMIRAWQPLRFKVPFDLMLTLGASYAMSEWLRSTKNSRSAWIPALVGLGIGAFFINLAQTEFTARLQLRSQFIPELKAIVDWIDRETPADARLLFEESGDETGFVYDRTYLSSFLPYLTGRQLIGGPINLYNDRHHFAEFHSGKLFQKEPQPISDSELRNYLRLYNIGAVVAFDPRSIQRLQSIPGLVTVEQRIGPIHLMKVNQPLSWFQVGEGSVKAGYNRLELSGLKGNEVVLKYHWVDGLRAVPPTRIEPVQVADDPIPFIKLVNPPAAVTLRIAASF
jgi:hypothetical protein